MPASSGPASAAVLTSWQIERLQRAYFVEKLVLDRSVSC
jgi:hypothetical protein